MKILELTIANIGPHENVRVPLCDHVTIIRGENGSGKTTVLEAAALLGHASVMEVSDRFADDSDARVEMRLRYDANDIQYIEECDNSYIENWIQQKLAHTEEAIAITKDEILEFLRQTSSVWITFRLDRQNDIWIKSTSDNVDLKEFLASEDNLRQWEIAPNKNYDFENKPGIICAIATQLIIHFSRPEQTDSEGEYSCPKRMQILSDNFSSCESSADPILPGFVSYFNTDMYEYGVGLDIRESPKHLQRELIKVVGDRLHLLSKTNDNRGSLIAMQAVSQLFGMLLQYNAWSKERDAPTLLNKAIRLNWVVERVGDLPVSFVEIDRFRGVDANGETRSPERTRFLSSGENQALFFSIMSKSLCPRNSVFLMDEADLHLSLPAASRLYWYMIHDAKLRGNQYVIVTHLPIMHPQHLCDVDGSDGAPLNFNVRNPNKPVGLVYLKRPTGRAVVGYSALKLIANEFDVAMNHLYRQFMVHEKDVRMISGLRRYIFE